MRSGPTWWAVACRGTGPPEPSIHGSAWQGPGTQCDARRHAHARTIYLYKIFLALYAVGLHREVRMPRTAPHHTTQTPTHRPERDPAGQHEVSPGGGV